MYVAMTIGMLIAIALFVMKTMTARDANAVKQAGAALVTCRFCGTKGNITVTSGQVKTGISGGKATAGILTGGASLLAVGLSRKVSQTQATCNTCKSSWVY